MVLFVDEEVQGFQKNFEQSEELKEEVLKVLDERVESVTIKKRAVINNSPRDFTKNCQGNHGHK